MDHLALPQNPISPLPRCPLLCDPAESLAFDFEDYPLHASYPSDETSYWKRALAAQNQHHYADFVYKERFTPSITAELEHFLQSWLYFCQIRTLGLQTNCVNGQYVQSNQLALELDGWYKDKLQLPAAEKKQFVSQLARRLSLMNSALIASDLHKDFNTVLRKSLEALLELLSYALHGLDSTQDFWVTHIPWTAEERNSMLANGWCPFELHAAQTSTLHMSSRLFIQNMRMPSDSGDHASCTSDKCQYATIDPETYKVKHVKDCKEPCDLVGPDPEKIEECLRNGYPILDFDMNVVQYTGQAYVCLSHVWAQGLGNPSSMTLPRCQVERLKGLVQQFQGHRFVEWADQERETEREYVEARPLYFWCDTLCVPDSESRGLAIARMHDIYYDAQYCLVLERSLDIPYPGALEAAIRLNYSSWSFRGWTLQEAGLPQKLVFQFANGIVDLRQIHQELQKEIAASRSRRALQLHANSLLLALRGWCSRRYPDTPARTLKIAVANFTRRRLSVAKDEPICLSTLMELDSVRLAQNPSMERVWELFSNSEFGISQSMICNKQPRLETPGFRWAPKTLMGADADFDLAFGWPTDVKGQCTPHGLLVNGRAWRIRHGQPMHPMHHNEIAPITAEILQGNIGFKHGDERYLVGGAEHFQDTKDWVVVFDANIRRESQTYSALLTYQDGTIDGLPMLRTLKPIVVQRVHPTWEAMWRLGYREASLITRDWMEQSWDPHFAEPLQRAKDKDDVREAYAIAGGDAPFEVGFLHYIAQPLMGHQFEPAEVFPFGQKYYVD